MINAADGTAKPFPRGEGGFFAAHNWAVKKTDEEFGR